MIDQDRSDGAQPRTLGWAHSFADDLPELVTPWKADVGAAPELTAFNSDLASELGLDTEDFQTVDGLRQFLAGDGQAVAMAYAGHQFGSYSPRLGDGRALLLGELTDQRLDVHLKGSGATPYARSGDGKAALGPMLREYVVAESMHALGIPTTRSLAVIATGERVFRETALPGAILVRVAPSHLRVGTFEYAVRLGKPDVVKRLADHVIDRHYPGVAELDNPYLGLLDEVVAAQARLIAGWMAVGFIHGVMNTDNMAVSGHTIDYGPCAFLDEYDPSAVFSSIDRQGRYAYRNQPAIGVWNLSRFAETLLGVVADDQQSAIDAVTRVLEGYLPRYQAAWQEQMRAKLGFAADPAVGSELVDDLLELMSEHRADYTRTFVDLATWLESEHRPTAELWADERMDRWLQRWRQSLTAAGIDSPAAIELMRRTNPTYIPRNHLLEEALTAAESGDLQPVELLIAAVTDPYGVADHLEHLAEPGPEGFTDGYQTFCGT